MWVSSVFKSEAFFKPAFISAYLVNGLIPRTWKLSCELTSAAEHVCYTLALRAWEIAHYHAVPAVKVSLVEYHLSACNDTGYSWLAELLCFVNSHTVLFKSKRAAKLHILCIAVPLGIDLFAYNVNNNVCVLSLIWICYNGNSVLLGNFLESLKYGSSSRDILCVALCPVKSPAAALCACIIGSRSYNIYR